MSLMWYDPFYSRPAARRPFLDDDFFGPLMPREFKNLLSLPQQMLSQVNTGDEVAFDKDKFNVNVDVQQFRPDEITVKVNDNTITVEGKHEERPDEHGYISRQFVRRYVVPENHDLSKVESRLSSDGVLSITAPRVGGPEADTRQIPIQHTGQPSKAIESKPEKK